MGDCGDVNMSDASSDDDVQPLDYGIPAPPRLPLVINDNGTHRETSWGKDASRFRAKRNTLGTGFDVCRDVDIIPETPDRWPYHLGVPSSKARCDPLMRVWGLQILDAAGFINYHQRDPEAFMYPQARLFEEEITEDSRNALIHPVLDRNVFRNISQEDYELMTPAIILASAFLENETTMTFFYALSHPSCWHVFWDPVHGFCFNIRLPDTLSEDEQDETFHKISAMSKWTSWGIGETAVKITDTEYGHCAAKTYMGKHIPASAPGTLQTCIDLNSTFLEVLQSFEDEVSNGSAHHKAYLQRGMDALGMPQNCKIEIDSRSANLRTNVILATTIIHELAHAFCKAYYPDTFTPGGYTEPWVSDHRANEMGHALIHHVLGGELKPLCIWSHLMPDRESSAYQISAPYGLGFSEQWVGKLVKATQSSDLPQVHVDYPIPQEHVDKLYDKEMWLRQVPRFGLNAVRAPKLGQWAVGKPIKKT